MIAQQSPPRRRPGSFDRQLEIAAFFAYLAKVCSTAFAESTERNPSFMPAHENRTRTIP